MRDAAQAPLVLVLRDPQDARRTAQRLEAMGFRALAAPLIATRETGAPAPAGPFDALIVTSAKAAPYLARAGDLASTPVFAVGARSGQAAREAGARHVRTGEGDAAALAVLVAESLPCGARLLHVAGEDRKPEPEGRLRALGFDLSTWTAYRAAALPLAEPARAALVSGDARAALHYSRRSAGLFVEALAQAGLSDRLPRLLHATISPDAALPLRDAGAAEVAVAPTPDESALLRTFADAASVAFGAEWRLAR